MPSLLRVAVFVCGVSSVCAVFESHQTTLAPDSDFALLRGAALRFAHSETAALAAPRAQTYPPSCTCIEDTHWQSLALTEGGRQCRSVRQ